MEPRGIAENHGPRFAGCNQHISGWHPFLYSPVRRIGFQRRQLRKNLAPLPAILRPHHIGKGAGALINISEVKKHFAHFFIIGVAVPALRLHSGCALADRHRNIEGKTMEFGAHLHVGIHRIQDLPFKHHLYKGVGKIQGRSRIKKILEKFLFGLHRRTSHKILRVLFEGREALLPYEELIHVDDADTLGRKLTYDPPLHTR
ncbi:MAG: hypothetical protein Greene071436_317 [Parcubacteria group bacterium Greene0714_36]|nr:MAG: hypothetical protein Greene071436_317 [Parcubacteria group bacterium Greene0714_36]